MEKQLQRVTIDQAICLDKAGFDWPCEHYYKAPAHNREDWHTDASLLAPTIALALKWVRDVKGIRTGIHPVWRRVMGRPDFMFYEISYMHGQDNDIKCVHDSYEAAESALLDELLKLIEDEC